MPTKMKIVAGAFREVAARIATSPSPMVPVELFSNACSLFSDLFGVLEKNFKFVKVDYVSKFDDLAKASSSIMTLDVMIDEDIKAGRAKRQGSHTRNLLRIKRALEMIRVLFEEIIATNANSSLKDAALKAYNKVLANYHGQVLQDSAAIGMNSLATREIYLR